VLFRSTDKLTWAPPGFSNDGNASNDYQGYTTVTVPTTDNNTNRYELTLNDSTDYVVKLPSTVRGPLVVNGGRNIVIIGGHIRGYNVASSVADAQQRLLMFTDGANAVNGRIVHVEGVLLESPNMTPTRDVGEYDGIDMDADNAVFQIENIRLPVIWGSDLSETGYEGFASNHADLIQAWGGAAGVRIDKFTGSSWYQGFQIDPDLGPVGPVTIKRVNLVHAGRFPGTGLDGGGAGGGYLLWLQKTGFPASTAIEDLYLKSAIPGQSFNKMIWPETATFSTVGGTQQATWNGANSITGTIKYGDPPGGDYVPSGVAGETYTSPGYN
jgi:hypothetical protein